MVLLETLQAGYAILKLSAAGGVGASGGTVGTAVAVAATAGTDLITVAPDASLPVQPAPSLEPSVGTPVQSAGSELNSSAPASPPSTAIAAGGLEPDSSAFANPPAASAAIVSAAGGSESALPNGAAEDLDLSASTAVPQIGASDEVTAPSELDAGKLFTVTPGMDTIFRAAGIEATAPAPEVPAPFDLGGPLDPFALTSYVLPDTGNGMEVSAEPFRPMFDAHAKMLMSFASGNLEGVEANAAATPQLPSPESLAVPSTPTSSPVEGAEEVLGAAGAGTEAGASFIGEAAGAGTEAGASLIGEAAGAAGSETLLTSLSILASVAFSASILGFATHNLWEERVPPEGERPDSETTRFRICGRLPGS